MKKNNRSIIFYIKFLICIILILSTTGCWNSRELDTIAFVVGIGLDKPQEEGKIQMTAQVVKPESLKSGRNKGGGGQSEKSYWNIVNTDDTIFHIIRGFAHVSSRRLFFPHNQIIIFSEDLARTGIQQCIDLFIRDPEPRLSTYILVSKGKASDILDVKPPIGNLPASHIADLVKNQAVTSQSAEMKLKDFATMLLSKTTCPIAPLIEIQKVGDQENVYISGLAVFKDGKMVGELDATETRGLLWALGKVKSGIIVVDSPDNGGKASLETIRASGKIKPEIKNNKITFKVKIKEEGNIGDQSGPGNLTTIPAVKALEKMKSDIIKSEIMAALKKAKELDTDIFGFGEIIHEKYPKEWKELKKNWDSYFKNIELSIEVDAKLLLAGKINKPVSPKE